MVFCVSRFPGKERDGNSVRVRIAKIHIVPRQWDAFISEHKRMAIGKCNTSAESNFATCRTTGVSNCARIPGDTCHCCHDCSWHFITSFNQCRFEDWERETMECHNTFTFPRALWLCNLNITGKKPHEKEEDLVIEDSRDRTVD
jgi:hypothetical protein